MNSEMEVKKWFVYLRNHHEGPFSVEELYEKAGQGVISDRTYVWSDGMKDWALMREVDELQSLSDWEGEVLEQRVGSLLSHSHLVQEQNKKGLVSPSLFSSNGMADVFSPFTSQEVQKNNLFSEQKKFEKEQKEKVQQAFSQLPSLEAPENPSSEKERSSQQETFRSRVPFVWLMSGILGFLFFLSFTWAGLFYLQKTSSLPPLLQRIQTSFEPALWMGLRVFPLLQKWFPLFPELPDLSVKDQEALKNALLAPLRRDGLRVAFILSPNDLAFPTFYVGTNLPPDEPIFFELTLRGVSDTLLGTLDCQKQEQAVPFRHIASFSSLQTLEGKPFPMGEYRVSLSVGGNPSQVVQEWVNGFEPILEFESEPSLKSEAEKKILINQTFFLGGVRDEAYQVQLKEFHRRFLAQSQEEFLELNQFWKSLNQQFQDSLSEYQGFRLKQGESLVSKAAVLESKKKAWLSFHEKWLQWQDQLTGTFNQWTPAFLQEKYIHQDFYVGVKQVGEKLIEVHELQHAFLLASFSAPKDLQMEERLIQEHVMNLQSLLSELQLKIQEKEARPLGKLNG